LLEGWSAAGAIKAEHRQPGPFIHRVRHVLVKQTPDAVFRAEQRHQVNFRSAMKEVDRRIPFPIGAGVIGDQADFETPQRRKIREGQHVDAVAHLEGSSRPD
jgi:hypothetical protein